MARNVIHLSHGILVVLVVCSAAVAAEVVVSPTERLTDPKYGLSTGSPDGKNRQWEEPLADEPAGPQNQTMTIPLNDGKLRLGRLAEALLRKVGVNGNGFATRRGPQIEVNQPAGRLTLMLITRATQQAFIFEVSDRKLVVKIDEAKLRREEKRVRSATRLLVARWFPDVAAQAEEAYGIHVHTQDGTTAPPSATTVKPEVVVLVHGLDDPGQVWSLLVPSLVCESYIVCEFKYPNDQPISLSAELLNRHLEALKELGVRRVTLIAHSMGGLVSRELLTSPRYYAGRGSGHATRPDVTRLIMVATPNQGSELARFRFATELCEQAERQLGGNGGFLIGIFDGAGEAKIDLLPSSEFLQTLNARKTPNDVEFSIIAGRSSPITTEMVEALRSGLEATRPELLRDLLDHTVSELSPYTDGVSDGLVTIESTRLAEVKDHVIVDGNHTTVIRNLTSTSHSVPPAIPLILARLRSDSGAE